jgi:hypothetical protein
MHTHNSALTSFPKYVGADTFFSIALVDMVCATITEKLIAIVPQPTDYSEFGALEFVL